VRRVRHGLRVLGQGLARSGRAVAHSKAGRFVGAKARALAKSRTGRAVGAAARGLGRVVGKLWLGTTARLTLGADWIERRLPGVWGKRFHQLRSLDPIAVGEFALHKIKRDPIFFATYGTWSMALSWAIVPAAMSLGVGPVAATMLRFATGTPIDLTAITLRVHSQRKDRSQTFSGTLRSLRTEYRDFLVDRRARHRQHMEARPASSLRQLGAKL
jgi:hypothetical protein